MTTTSQDLQTLSTNIYLPPKIYWKARFRKTITTTSTTTTKLQHSPRSRLLVKTRHNCVLASRKLKERQNNFNTTNVGNTTRSSSFCLGKPQSPLRTNTGTSGTRSEDIENEGNQPVEGDLNGSCSKKKKICVKSF